MLTRQALNNGLIGLPLAERKGINLPTPENLQRVADEAAAKRNRTVAEVTPQDRKWGVSKDMVSFLQRLEILVLEQGRRIAQLEAAETSALPRHMQDVERR